MNIGADSGFRPSRMSRAVSMSRSRRDCRISRSCSSARSITIVACCPNSVTRSRSCSSKAEGPSDSSTIAPRMPRGDASGTVNCADVDGRTATYAGSCLTSRTSCDCPERMTSPTRPVVDGTARLGGSPRVACARRISRPSLEQDRAAVEWHELVEALEEDRQRRLKFHRNGDAGQRLKEKIELFVTRHGRASSLVVYVPFKRCLPTRKRSRCLKLSCGCIRHICRRGP